MDAELGHNPSFMWRSLLAARDLIREGSLWKIGNGQSVQVNCNKWLPHPPLFKPGANTHMKVADLIHHRTMQWNRPLLQATFMQSTQKDILRIPLSNTHAMDRLYWKENKAQQVTVRTAYSVVLRLQGEPGPEHSSIPPKVCNFVWKACTDILPTRAHLYRRKVPIDPPCLICGQIDETVGHALWECPLAKNVWAVDQGRL
ncbi:hypothetical protein SO802_027569 [Lithocarpus litseifolius]|uniref:Reverse transcriptase zinc-binding domain-containing protein n=1 Tax=Lithocarpus litseifolius TaxID=425828 RepID=A0AAW2C6J0_9ROSI